ncbi:glycoside hydrolase family 73 protein [Weissella koreensis]|uniref:Mannosyl-glycoprotein endo-beta-N-acetylglucosamidase n=2 Tax=Weissella koreensis TaxID=165096 RepID=A0A7H1MMW6_9LACO|nr:glycoside hydrolase family 73 protein [Weissella koreensis]AEJ23985.1 exoglucosaminidase [Weissella koreensis KACC 15510]AVH75839.1 mannosyl-glycoprotein endo-beta-N-acetylglucosamidase [Weissella koreensis]QGN20821.1 mannosyl-glycoprotein endo-beta-N-acetylglucosamidase [Weissella koreensis]QNT64802.1 mannosyl-glycoprotein endo-beta-N-acetylglucosamidase [Weissella koreensis]
MAKKRNKWIKKFNLKKVFVKKGRLQVGRVLIVLCLLLLGVSRVSDLLHYQPSQSVDVSKLPMNKLTKQQFIQRIAPEAQDIQTQTGIRASISIAQAGLESDWGKSTLAYKYNNFFGVKASSGMQSIDLSTSEYIDNKWVQVKAPFRVYSSWQASMEDHADLLLKGTTDNPNRYARVVSGSNVEESAQALVDGGYATDPDYAVKLIDIIKTYNLTQYDH